MKEPDDELGQAIALFRYGVIADLVHLPLGTKGVGDEASREGRASPMPSPEPTRTRVAADTMRELDHRTTGDGGFEALYPKPRTDRGKPRRLPPEVAERLVALKADNPAWPVRLDHPARRAEEGIDHPLAPSTVHRLLSPRGAVRQEAAERRRRPPPLRLPRGRRAVDERRHARAQGPASAGVGARPTSSPSSTTPPGSCPSPPSPRPRTSRPSCLTFKNALIRRGLPQRLYVDNGAAYRSRHLALICARLGVVLVHARPYQPAGKGKIERWFRTLRAGWLAHRRCRRVLDSLQTLNRSLLGVDRGRVSQHPASRP